MKIPILVLVLGAAGFCATRVIGAAHGDVRADRFQTTYYASGQMETKYECADGKRQGAAQKWHANGQLMAEGRYQDGHMEGAWHFWNAEGKPDVQRTGMYQNGERVADLAAGADDVHGE